jgi:biotin carboxyl carrier protein
MPDIKIVTEVAERAFALLVEIDDVVAEGQVLAIIET